MSPTVRQVTIRPIRSAIDPNPVPVALGGGEPVERVTNGGFADDTGWSGAGWTVAGGVATNDAAGQFLVGELDPPIAPGETASASIAVTDNPNGVTWMLFLYNTTTLASQTLINESGGMPGLFLGSDTASGAFDAVRIRAIGDAGLVVDNVSIMA